MKKVLCMLLIMMLCAGCACAEGYVSVADLRQQVEETGWDKCEVILPAVDAVPVFTVSITPFPAVFSPAFFPVFPSADFGPAASFAAVSEFFTGAFSAGLVAL